MDKLLVSFSGGKTSAFMTKWILDNWSNMYDIKVVFANTGKERSETLDFVNQCDKNLGFKVIWVEAKINEGRKGTGHSIVSYESASRNGEPYEEMIKKYGIPNVSFPHCTRELKTSPIHHYIKSLGWSGYYTAIGIRADEFDRMDSKRKEKRYLYPLVSNNIVKKDIQEFWLTQDFNLNLNEHQGNCNKCFKKTLRKLLTIELEERESGNIDRWWHDMENKYQYHVPVTQKNRPFPIRFNRKNITCNEITELSKQPFERFIPNEPLKESDLEDLGSCSESCEAF